MTSVEKLALVLKSRKSSLSSPKSPARLGCATPGVYGIYLQNGILDSQSSYNMPWKGNMIFIVFSLLATQHSRQEPLSPSFIWPCCANGQKLHEISFGIVPLSRRHLPLPPPMNSVRLSTYYVHYPQLSLEPFQNGNKPGDCPRGGAPTSNGQVLVFPMQGGSPTHSLSLQDIRVKICHRGRFFHDCEIAEGICRANAHLSQGRMSQQFSTQCSSIRVEQGFFHLSAGMRTKCMLADAIWNKSGS